MRISKILVISMLIVLSVLSISYADDRVSLGFLYGWTGNIDLIDRTNGGINQVSPTCLDLTDNGNLLVTSNLTHEFVIKMHERNIKVTPFLSNHWARQKGRNAINNAEVLSDQIVATVIEYELDGVNVDIENLTIDDRDALSEFVRILKSKMPEGTILSVSVAANPYDSMTGWQGSYDYDKLGENSDYLFIMSYDEHGIGGPEGPVSSTYFYEKSILTALNHVSKDKIVMGIPFFGRYWKLDEDTGEYSGGQAIVIGAVPALMDKTNGTYVYNELVGEACYTFTITDESEPVSINGTTLTSGTYQVWFQTNDSIRDKLWLINFYDLLGAGVWALGQEKAEVWKYYYTRLNEKVRIPEEQIILSIVDEATSSAANRIDFTPINDQIVADRTSVSDVAANSVTQTNSETTDKVYRREDVVDKAPYKKLREKVKQLFRKKKEDDVEVSNNNHIFRMEANY